jgi:hypothetical protein
MPWQDQGKGNSYWEPLISEFEKAIQKAVRHISK